MGLLWTKPLDSGHSLHPLLGPGWHVPLSRAPQCPLPVFCSSSSSFSRDHPPLLLRPFPPPPAPRDQPLLLPTLLFAPLQTQL